MNKAKMNRLRAAGWKVGSAQEFLALSHEEVALIEMKLALARSLKERRNARSWSQTELASRLATSQSRVAKMEAADASVSLELLVRALLALGADRKEVARLLGRRIPSPAA